MATQVSLTDGAVASAGALAIQTNGTTQAVSISTGQVATLAQNPILTSGTANGVAYLNGSKAVTSGSALTFDGTNFATTGTASATKMIPTGGSATGNGMYLPASNTLAWSNNGSETMRLDSSGNLGLGVTPSAWNSSRKAMQVNTAALIGVPGASSYANIAANVFVNSSGSNTYIGTDYASMYEQYLGKHAWYTAASGTAGNAITFTQAMTLDASGNLLVGTTTPLLNAANRGNITLNGSSSTIVSFGVGGTNSGYIYTDSPSFVLMAAGSRAMTFGTNDTERARIDSSGNLLVGTTSHTDGSIFQTTTTTPLNSYRATATASGGIYGAYSDVGGTKTVRAYFRADGGLANYSANDVNLSDERLKKDISIAGSYLEKICAIPVKTFRYKDQSNTEDLTIGVIAQDVLAIAPELVSQDGFGLDEKENYLSVYQTDLQYALMKCIQEQQALITQLQADVAALKGA